MNHLFAAAPRQISLDASVFALSHQKPRALHWIVSLAIRETCATHIDAISWPMPWFINHATLTNGLAPLVRALHPHDDCRQRERNVVARQAANLHAIAALK